VTAHWLDIVLFHDVQVQCNTDVKGLVSMSWTSTFFVPWHSYTVVNYLRARVLDAQREQAFSVLRGFLTLLE